MKEEFFQHFEMRLDKIRSLTDALESETKANPDDPGTHYKIAYLIGQLSQAVDSLFLETLDKSIKIYNPIPDTKE